MKRNFKIEDRAIEAIRNYTPPNELIFGQAVSPVMFRAQFSSEKWGELSMIPFENISLSPCAKVLHYGQEIFEGLKAYNFNNLGPQLFRPQENWKRMNHSAQRMAMPPIPADIFMTAVRNISAYSAHLIPTASGESLYIRPFMIATEPNIGIKPSTSFDFLVVACPVGNYFTGDSISVLVDREYARATPGGTGNAKTGGNYAASLLSSINATKLGFNQVLWTDAKEHKFIEELSGMNFFAIVDGALHTPEINDSILSGITRDSIIHLAQQQDIEVQIGKMKIDQLINDIQSGRCTEAFACGTAIILTPISALGSINGTKITLPESEGKISLQLKKMLLDIQEGRSQGPSGWVEKITPITL